jgi:hypothetical protein
MNCGREIPGGSRLIAYYVRPSVNARYFGLRAVCDDCSSKNKEWTSDYVVPIASDDVSCGDWLRWTEEHNYDLVTKGVSPPDNDLPPDPQRPRQVGFAAWSRARAQ